MSNGPAASVTLASPAKLNWGLRVGNREAATGYHYVATVLQAIDLADTLSLTWGEAEMFQLTVLGNDALSEAAQKSPLENLVGKAYEAFYQALGSPPVPVSVTLHKRIPTQAGLGGGSSNAATMLRALNQYHSHPFSVSELEAIAGPLGADVPFFITAQPALGSHYGEQLQPVLGIAGGLPVVVVKPTTIHMPTPHAYQQLARRDGPPLPDDALKPLIQALQTQDWAKVANLGTNDFESVALTRHPAMQAISRALKTTDPQPLWVRLSGSGTAWVAVYPPGQLPLLADLKKNLGEVDCQIERCKTLSGLSEENNVL